MAVDLIVQPKHGYAPQKPSSKVQLQETRDVQDLRRRQWQTGNQQGSCPEAGGILQRIAGIIYLSTSGQNGVSGQSWPRREWEIPLEFTNAVSAARKRCVSIIVVTRLGAFKVEQGENVYYPKTCGTQLDAGNHRYLRPTAKAGNRKQRRKRMRSDQMIVCNEASMSYASLLNFFMTYERTWVQRIAPKHPL
jgi:hypothetical protein